MAEDADLTEIYKVAPQKLEQHFEKMKKIDSELGDQLAQLDVGKNNLSPEVSETLEVASDFLEDLGVEEIDSASILTNISDHVSSCIQENHEDFGTLNMLSELSQLKAERLKKDLEYGRRVVEEFRKDYNRLDPDWENGTAKEQSSDLSPKSESSGVEKKRALVEEAVKLAAELEAISEKNEELKKGLGERLLPSNQEEVKIVVEELKRTVLEMQGKIRVLWQH